MPSDLRAEAALRLERILDFAAKGPNGSLRTHLDEWAAYTIGGDLLTRGGRQRWFNNPCPWQHGATLLRHMDWFSLDAAQILRRGIDRDPAVRKPKRGAPAPYRLIVEHAVPVKVIAWVITQDSSLHRHDRLSDFLAHHYKRAVLTRREDETLRSAPSGSGASLVAEMPVGWRPWGDPFARYHAAGIA